MPKYGRVNMKKNLIRCPSSILSMILILFIIHIYNSLLSGEAFKIITDLGGNKVEVPVNPKKIASLHGPAYDRIIMLGKIDNIAILMSNKQSSWAFKLYPQLTKIPVMKSYTDVDVEQMLRNKIDLVFYSYFPQQAERVKSVDIKIACSFDVNDRPKNMKEFVENFKKQILFFGEVLGPDAMAQANKYCTYFDKKITAVLNVTSKISENNKPKVYYGGRSGSLFYTQGKNTVMQWYTELAGGIFVTRVLNNNYPEVNTEQVLSWDPDIILVSGMFSSLDAVRDNEHWSSMKAVKNGKLYLIPAGIFAWDFASGESILLGLYLAKKFHPELFKNWDIIQEMKTFYAEMYNKNLTNGDVDRILRCLPPL
jgi:iron complex transport system substrate-binding protein